jgi:hypothetical protein
LDCSVRSSSSSRHNSSNNTSSNSGSCWRHLGCRVMQQEQVLVQLQLLAMLQGLALDLVEVAVMPRWVG